MNITKINKYKKKLTKATKVKYNKQLYSQIKIHLKNITKID